MSLKANDPGSWGEKLVSEFFDSHFSRQFSFPNPKTKSKVEMADVLIWWNRVVFLVEVKTRSSETGDANAWASSRIRQAVEQLQSEFALLQGEEQINLNNRFYNTCLIREGLSEIIGLIILVSEQPLDVVPEEVCETINQQGFPIHVFSWCDLEQMTKEIDTVSDLRLYLNDRRALFTSGWRIPLGREMHAVASYKIHRNRFPKEATDFGRKDVLNEYLTGMQSEILARQGHNRCAALYDRIADSLPNQRKLFEGVPIGLYFAWELSSLTRRERAYWGEKLSSVQDWFWEGKQERKFSFFSQMTGNWILFFWSKQELPDLQERLMRLVKLKYIREAHLQGFDRGVYGLGFQVSRILPPRSKLVAVTVCGPEAVSGFSDEDLHESLRELGDKSVTNPRRIEEFPGS